MRFSIILIVLIIAVVSASVILYVNHMKSRNTITTNFTIQSDINMTGIYKLGIFASSCENMCKTKAIFSFCTTKFTGDVDLNRNGVIDSIKTISGFNACEDGIYCMHAYQCKFNGAILQPKDCKNILCSAYKNLYDNSNSVASQAVYATFPSIGSCHLTDQENWWLTEGFGPQPPCGQ
jgi:hypothetical protein